MPSRSPAPRSTFLVALVVAATACLGMGAATAAAQSSAPPMAITSEPQEITESSALLRGFGQSNVQTQGQVPTYSYTFQYGTTTAYGQSTPVAQATNGQQVSQRVTGLAHTTEYHFRIVVQDANGTTVGNDQTFRTLTPPYSYVKPAGATTFSGTVGPGGSVTSGSDPSSSNPIVVKVTTEKGGKLYIDNIKNPSRPTFPAEADTDPEDPGARIRDFYGPAVRIFTEGAERQELSVITAVFTIDGGTNLTDGYFQNLFSMRDGASSYYDEQGLTNPVIVFDDQRTKCPAYYVNKRRSDPFSKVHYLANGDVQLTYRFICPTDRSASATFHFFNRPWRAPTKASGTGPDGFNTLDNVLARGYLTTDIVCFLKCSRSVTATISSKTAKALKLRSTTLSKASTRPSSTSEDDLKSARKGAQLRLPLSTAERRALKRANRITVSFQMKAVGPDGQVWKKTAKLTLKKDEDEDSIN